MSIQTIFFEDAEHLNFHPLTLTRPVYDLRVGILTLGQKWNLDFGISSSPCGPLRSSLQGVFQNPVQLQSGESSLWINSRVFPDPDLVRAIQNLDKDTAILHKSTIIAAKLRAPLHNQWLDAGIDTATLDCKTYETAPSILDDIWQIFQLNGREIGRDLDRLKHNRFASPEQYPQSVMVNRENIFIEEGAVIEPGAILYADKGPIYVGKNAHIMANAVIRGSTAICERSVVKMGAKIYKDTTIGPVCKVGGEISNVVFHSYSNKAHDGYAGNSVFGQWCNIGADTNTSNLKNNYSTIKFRKWESEQVIDSKQQFLGTIMGDHSKTGINSMLNTGTLCGVCCNLFSDGYPPKFIPSFSWVSGKNIVPYHFDKALDAMAKMMERRDVVLTSDYRSMMQSINESTM
ncbi:MAG: glucose-1-phosphate thymidylyltransferase [Bacteroidetes bacterium]|jgi:UDP-N-acetylglucosamine diphosphorylase/glucosamine-1-phosphate N-acetyltransferase|nr:glucose-1-phosphate thymidylyltransferase [Bacteroidota bacterium]